MKKLILAALLSATAVAAEAQVVISFTANDSSFSGTLTIDTLALGPNGATAPDTSYTTAGGFVTLALSSGGSSYTLIGTPIGADIYSSTATGAANGGSQIDAFTDDGSSNGSFFIFYNVAYSPTGSTNEFGNVLLPDFRPLPNLFFTYQNGAANVAINGAVTVTGYADATPAVPEPASWAMMVGGFGLIGGVFRRRRMSIAFA